MSGGSRFANLYLDEALRTVDTHISARCAISDDLSSSLLGLSKYGSRILLVGLGNIGGARTAYPRRLKAGTVNEWSGERG
jgi:hypothetical protein